MLCHQMAGRLSALEWTNLVRSQQQPVDFLNQMQWTNETVVEKTRRKGVGCHSDSDLPPSPFASGPVVTSFGSYCTVQTPNGVTCPRHIVYSKQELPSKDKNSSLANGFSLCDVTFHKCEEDGAVSSTLEQVGCDINPWKARNMDFCELKSHSIPRENEQYKVNRNLITSVGPEAIMTNFLGSRQDSRKGEVVHLSDQTNSSTDGPSDSLICLKLGKQIDIEDTTGFGNARAETACTSAKRPRTGASDAQIPRCQVEGCKTDLTSMKDYHRRHKVCAKHSKAEKAIVASQEQRFCQQCSRFHVLSVFDEGKRSCRKRLAVHNKRRRKPQPDTLLMSGVISSCFQDGRSLRQFWPDGLPFWHHPEIPDIHNLWNNSNELTTMHGRGLWPRVMEVDDHSGYEYAMQSPGKERQAFLTSTSQDTNDKPPVLLLQSPKAASSVAHDVGDQRVHHQYLQDFLNPNCQGLSLSFSSGVLSDLEVTPSATQDLGVSAYSGRALSLLCPQLWTSSCTTMAVPLDLSTQSSMALDQPAHEDQVPISHLFGVNLTTEKLPCSASQLDNFLASVEHPTGSLDSLEGHCDVPSKHGFNESHPVFYMIQGHELRDSETRRSHHMKQSIDLMQRPSSQLQSSYQQGPVENFHLEDPWEGYKL